VLNVLDGDRLDDFQVEFCGATRVARKQVSEPLDKSAR
jgi:hypothetical protein